MTKFNASILAAAAALFVSTGAMAASLQPAAGNIPFVAQPVATSSTLTRSAVESQAAAQLPAAGDATFVALAGQSEVEFAHFATGDEAMAQLPAAGNIPFAS